jgi:hypothetical protein
VGGRNSGWEEGTDRNGKNDGMVQKMEQKKKIPKKGIPTGSRRYVGEGGKGGRGEGRMLSIIMGGV